jgi:hypothetical protein
VQVILQRDELRRLVGGIERIEADIGGHAGRALGSREELEQHDTVGLGIFAAGEPLGREWRNLGEELLVELLVELVGPSEGVGRDVGLARRFGRGRQQVGRLGAP